MPQAVKIVSQSEQQGLAALGKQAAAGCSAGEFAFGDREDGLNQCTTAIFFAGKIRTHLSTNAMESPRLLAALGRDDAESMKLLTDEGVVTLAVEFGVGQHAANPNLGMCLSHKFGKMSAIIPRSLPCRLRQNELPRQIDHRQPLQPMPPRQRLLGVVIHAAYEKRAHRALGQA